MAKRKVLFLLVLPAVAAAVCYVWPRPGGADSGVPLTPEKAEARERVRAQPFPETPPAATGSQGSP